MACRNAYKVKTIIEEPDVIQPSVTEPIVVQNVDRLLFGADSKIQINDLLQNGR